MTIGEMLERDAYELAELHTKKEKLNFLYEKGCYYNGLAEQSLGDEELFEEYTSLYMHYMNLYIAYRDLK